MKTQSIMVLGLIAAASLISVAVFSENTTQYSVASTAQQPIGIVGHLTMVATAPDGTIKQYVQTDNAIQTLGANCIINALFPAATGGTNPITTCVGDSGNFDTIQIGLGANADLDIATIASAATNIVTNPASGTVSNEQSTVGTHTAGFGANATVSVPFTANGANIITEALLTNATSGTIATLAYRTFGDITLADGDSLTVAWTVSVLEG